MAFSPAEKGLMERCVCGEVCAVPGAVPRCPAGRCRARRGPRSSRFSAGALGASTPRQSGRLQNPRDVRWELLQHARRREPFQPLPGTSHNRSCQLRDAALPARPARCAARPRLRPLLRPPPDTARGQGGGHSPAFHPHLCWVSPSDLALFCCRSLKTHLSLPRVPSASLESWSGVKHGGNPGEELPGHGPVPGVSRFAGTHLGHPWQPCRAVPVQGAAPERSGHPPGLLWDHREDTAAGRQPQRPFACPRGAPARGYPAPPSRTPQGTGRGASHRTELPALCPQRQPGLGSVVWGQSDL